MKRQVLRFVLGLGYVGLVMGLILVRLLASYETYGTADRAAAVLEMLLLGIPLIIVLVLYLRVTGKAPDRERKCAAPESYEEAYEKFLDTVGACGLSEREMEVAWLLYRGYTNRQIGEELFIAETTVKKHVSHIYEKMHLTGRKEFRAKVNGEAYCPRE